MKSNWLSSSNWDMYACSVGKEKWNRIDCIPQTEMCMHAQLEKKNMEPDGKEIEFNNTNYVQIIIIMYIIIILSSIIIIMCKFGSSHNVSMPNGFKVKTLLCWTCLYFNIYIFLLSKIISELIPGNFDRP